MLERESAEEIARILRKWDFPVPHIGDSMDLSYEKIVSFLRWADERLNEASITYSSKLVEEETDEYVKYDVSQKSVRCELSEENVNKFASGDRLAVGLAILITWGRPKDCSVHVHPSVGAIYVSFKHAEGRLVPELKPFDQAMLRRLGWGKAYMDDGYVFPADMDDGYVFLAERGGQANGSGS